MAISLFQKAQQWQNIRKTRKKEFVRVIQKDKGQCLRLIPSIRVGLKLIISKNIKIIGMDVTLIRNGYNLERRKMYLQNPRHNLKSSVQLLWQQSLQENPSHEFNRKKEQTAQDMKESYNRAIQKRLENELKLNKSTFRVMPAPGANKTIQPKNSNYYDSLNREVESQRQKKNFFDSPVSSRGNSSKSQSLSKSVFGYEIDRQVYRKESYLSKILGDRLEPFMKHTANNIPRHQSFTINQPVSLPY